MQQLFDLVNNTKLYAPEWWHHSLYSTNCVSQVELVMFYINLVWPASGLIESS